MKNKKPQLFINMDKADIPLTILWKDGDPGNRDGKKTGTVNDKASIANDSRWLPFFEEENRKVSEGVTIDGFYFTGWLYWHINHWWINKDKKIKKLLDDGSYFEDIIPDEGRPDLRDNELIINTGLRRATDPTNRNHLLILGARQIAKTTFEASFLGRSGLIYKGSQNLILSTGSGDLNNITAALDFGLLNCTKYFYVNRITKDWDQERVVLGTETKGRDRSVWAQYIIRNTSAGKKTEAGAGVTIKSGVYDEIGKESWLESFKAAEKAMVSRYGIRAVFIAVGTGGNFEKGEDAKKAMMNPRGHRFVPYKQKDGSETGCFISGLYRQDCKVRTTLAEFLLSDDYREIDPDSKITSIPEDSELWKTVFWKADKEAAMALILQDRELARLDSDPRLFLKTVAYDPITVDEIFLTDSNNMFGHLYEALEKHKLNVEENISPRYVDLYREETGTVAWKTSEKRPVSDFPIKTTTNTKAPVVILEEPIKSLPYATYVCGIDPYNQDKSSDAQASLGSCYIFKRMYDPFGHYQNAIVAHYTGRPDTLMEFYKICEMMIDMYSALALPENEGSIIQYFIQNKKDYVLFDSPALTRYINPASATQSRQKGLAPTTPNQRHYMKLMLGYDEEPIIEVIDGVEVQKFGLIRIQDPMLLKEMMNYKGKESGATRGVHAGNFDRICAFGHCLALANYLDRDFPVLGYKQKEEDSEFRDPSFLSPFPMIRRDSGGYISPFK